MDDLTAQVRSALVQPSREVPLVDLPWRDDRCDMREDAA